MQALASAPRAKKILLLFEPPLVDKAHYESSFHDNFDAVFTMCDMLLENKKYKKLYYPQPSLIPVAPIAFHKKKFCVTISGNKYESGEIFHDWINLHKPYILRKTKFTKNSVDYDICVNPTNYLKSLFYMNKELEKLNNERIQEDKDQFKLFQVIPQKTSIKSCYICIDTASLINLVIDENSLEYLNNVEKYQKELWEKHFNLKQKEFKRKGYQFNYMIKTVYVFCYNLL